MEAAVKVLTAAGATVVNATIANDGRWNAPEMDVLLYEFKDGLNAYLARSGAPQASLETLIAWNTAHKEQVMPFFGQELFEQAQAKGPLTDAAYLKARDTAKRLAGKDGLLATLEKDALDALIAPSVGPAWPTDHVLGDHFSRRGLWSRRGRGHSKPDGADWRRARPAAGPHLHGPPIHRGGPAGLGLRLRAGDESEKTAGLQALPR